jgi:anoctamin-10
LSIVRVRDWIHGVRVAAPEKETSQALEKDPLYEAERLRIIYQLITNDTEDGGAGITPKHGDWKNVESIFALHNHAYNKHWIKHWSVEWFLKPEDLDEIRNRLGEKACPTFAATNGY